MQIRKCRKLEMREIKMQQKYAENKLSHDAETEIDIDWDLWGDF